MTRIPISDTSLSLPVSTAFRLCAIQLCDEGQINHCLFEENKSLCLTACQNNYPIHPALRVTPLPAPPETEKWSLLEHLSDKPTPHKTNFAYGHNQQQPLVPTPEDSLTPLDEPPIFGDKL